MILDSFPSYFLGEERKNLKKNWGQNWKSILHFEDSKSYKFYLISLSSLDVREVALHNVLDICSTIEISLKN